jgi:DNA-binding MarR family transcriptional regulator
METQKPHITEPIGPDDIENIDLFGLLFFAYRDFVTDPDNILKNYGFGRAHHRVLYFVNRNPGLTVAELLDTLEITKQSLARVLKQLIETGHIYQAEGKNDRRKRLLFPTIEGRNLFLDLSGPQSKRIADALDTMSHEQQQTVHEFLKNMTN